MKIQSAMGALAVAFWLSACAAPAAKRVEPQPPEPVASVPEYTPKPGLSSQQRFREVLVLLEAGEPIPARVELAKYLESQPRSAVARNLLQQIDQSALDYFPSEYKEIKLASGQSLSNLSQQYLGSLYQFHALAKYNGIVEPRNLRAGQTIRIPLTDTAIAAFEAGTSESTQAEEMVSAYATMDSGQVNEIVEQEEAALSEEVDDAVEQVVEAQEAAAQEVVEAVEPAVSDATDVVELPAVVQEVADSGADVDALYRDALNAYRAQNLDKAIALWDQVLELAPDHENARLYRSQAVELKDKLQRLN